MIAVYIASELFGYLYKAEPSGVFSMIMLRSDFSHSDRSSDHEDLTLTKMVHNFEIKEAMVTICVPKHEANAHRLDPLYVRQLMSMNGIPSFAIVSKHEDYESQSARYVFTWNTIVLDSCDSVAEDMFELSYFEPA